MRQTLQGMHLWVDEEVVCPRLGFSIDVWVHKSPVLQQTGNTSWLGVKDGWAVEFDGSTPLFLASLRFCVHYCIDRDTVQKEKPRFAQFFCCDVHNKLENDLETT